MIDEFHVMYMYKKIQAEAATTDIKTLEQLLKKFRKVVAERREEYYREMGEKKAHKLKMKRLQMLLEKMENNHIYPEDLSCKKCEPYQRLQEYSRYYVSFVTPPPSGFIFGRGDNYPDTEGISLVFHYQEDNCNSK